MDIDDTNVERRHCPSCGERSRIITRGDSRATVVSACCEAVLPNENDELTTRAEDDEPTVHVEGGKLICPYSDCRAVGEIVELDVAVRTNALTVDGPGLIKAGLGEGFFEHDSYECQQCTRPVSLPDNYEVISA